MGDNDLSCFGFRAGTIFTVCRAPNQFQFQLIAQSAFLSNVCAVNIPSLAGTVVALYLSALYIQPYKLLLTDAAFHLE